MGHHVNTNKCVCVPSVRAILIICIVMSIRVYVHNCCLNVAGGLLDDMEEYRSKIEQMSLNYIHIGKIKYSSHYTHTHIFPPRAHTHTHTTEVCESFLYNSSELNVRDDGECAQ